MIASLQVVWLQVAATEKHFWVLRMYSTVLNTAFYKYLIWHSMSILSDIVQGIPEGIL